MAQEILDFFDEKLYNVEEPKAKKIKTKQMNEAKIEQEKEICPKVHLNQSFPRQPCDDYIASQIEYRVKILSSNSISLQPGEIKDTVTNLVFSKKLNKLAMHVKRTERQDFQLISEGFINPNQKGELSVKLVNSSNNTLYIPAGDIVGYLILTPFLV